MRLSLRKDENTEGCNFIKIPALAQSLYTTGNFYWPVKKIRNAIAKESANYKHSKRKACGD